MKYYFKEQIEKEEQIKNILKREKFQEKYKLFQRKKIETTITRYITNKYNVLSSLH
jgi:hypothetical protein